MSSILEVLLEAGIAEYGPLTKRDIAERGDLSESAVYRSEHWAALEELGVIEQHETGASISPALPSDRDRSELPTWMEDSLVNRRDLLLAIETRLASEDADYLNDPPPARRALSWPPDYGELFELWPWIKPWYEVIGELLDENDGKSNGQAIRFGTRPEQRTLTHSARPAAAG